MPCDDSNGNVTDTSSVVLIIIDMINDLEFPEGDEMYKPALAAARKIKKLKTRAQALRIPIIYANDNFGRWRSNFSEVLDHCLHSGVRGEPLARLLKPEKEDYFVLKPKHSAFFETNLTTLLKHFQAKTLILTGLSADSCIMSTAIDANMRDFQLVIPADCVASYKKTHAKDALQYMKRLLQADTEISENIDLENLLEKE